MEHKKANLLYNLNKEVKKYSKTSKIFKKDFINENIINNIQKLKNKKWDIDNLINVEGLEKYKNFITLYENLNLQFYAKREKNINIYKNLCEIRF